MKYLLLILSTSILLSGELEVDGDLKVTGNIQSADSLNQRIVNLEFIISQLQAQMALVGGDLGFTDCGGVWENDSNCVVIDLDGNTYEAIQIGEQLWMAENLKTTHYKNGDAIPTGLDNGTWITTSEGAFAIYGGDLSNVEVYGNLYNWFSVDDSRGICMEGWHVPTKEDWEILILDYAGGYEVGGDYLKDDELWNGSDDFGFSVLPGGYRHWDGGYYLNALVHGYFWSSTYVDPQRAVSFVFEINSSTINTYHDWRKFGFSVRCIQD